MTELNQTELITGDLPYPGIKPMSPALEGAFFMIVPLGKPHFLNTFK